MPSDKEAFAVIRARYVKKMAVVEADLQELKECLRQFHAMKGGKKTHWK